MVPKRKRDRNERGAEIATPDAHTHNHKRSKSSKRTAKELGKEMRESRSVSIHGDSGVTKPLEMQAATPESKVKRRRKRASTSAKQLVADLNNPSHQSSTSAKHAPITLRRSIGGMPSRETPQEQSSEHEGRPVDGTPSKTRKVLRPAGSKVDSAEKQPKKKKPRREPREIVQSAEDPRGAGWNELLERYTPDGPIYSDDDEDEIVNTTEGIESNTPASPELTDATDSKNKKLVVRRARGYQPWNVNKHIIMSRDLLRDARKIDLDPEVRRTLRKRLDLQKDTKATFAEVIKNTNYSWSPPTSLDAATSSAIYNDLAELASRTNIGSEARNAMLESIYAYRQAQLAIHNRGKEHLAEKVLVEANTDELLSAARTIKGHVKLAQETLRNSLQHGRNIKVRHIHDAHWELHSVDHVKRWAKTKDTDWEVPVLLFQRNDCQLENGERKHRCHIAGLVLGGEKFETHCLQIPKHASLEPIVAPTQEGRYVEGGEDTGHIEMTFFGHGCMALQVPKRLVDRNIVGKRGRKSKAMVDFYAVQVAAKKDD